MTIQLTPVRTLRSNGPEQKFIQLAHQMNFRATKRGWPDFLCFNDATGEVIVVEVKPRLATDDGFKIPKRDQVAAMTFLQAHGIKCYVSDGVLLEEFNPDTHAPAYRRRSVRDKPMATSRKALHHRTW